MNCNRYVVEHTLVGKKVMVRLRHRQLRIFDNDRLVVTYTVPEGVGEFVEDPRFYAALKADVEMQQRKFAHPDPKRKAKGRAVKQTVSPTKPPHPIDVVSFEANNNITPVEVPATPSVEVQRRSLADYAAFSGEVRHAG